MIYNSNNLVISIQIILFFYFAVIYAVFMLASRMQIFIWVAFAIRRKFRVRRHRTIYLFMNMSARHLFSSAFNGEKNFYRHSHENLQRDLFFLISRVISQPRLSTRPGTIFAKLPLHCTRRLFLLPTLIYLTKKRYFSAFMLRSRKTNVENYTRRAVVSSYFLLDDKLPSIS